MKKIFLILSVFLMSHAYAAHEPNTDKILLQTIVNSLTDTYSNLLDETLDSQRDLKRALPLIGKKKKIKKIACDKIEMVTSYTIYLLEETSREVKTIDLPNEEVETFTDALSGILRHSKQALSKCEDLDTAITELNEVEKDITTTLDILSRLR